MGLKSLHFESPGRRNFNVFAQLNFIYATSVKIAPLPHENLILTYSRLPKMSKKSYKNPSKRPSKSISSCKGSWNPKNHDFHVKNIDFRVAKNSGFFSKSRPGGGGPRGRLLVFFLQCCFFRLPWGSGAVSGPDLDLIFHRFSVFSGFRGGFWTRFGPDFRPIFCIFGGLERLLDPIWTRLSTDFLSFRASCSHGSLPLRGLVGMREA